jgi:transcriptional regulator with XRE-family HTH domain
MTPASPIGPGEEPGELRSRVAATVRGLRVSSGRSLSELASAAGIGKSTLHAIEAGEANPGIETLWALARALGVPFGALLEPPGPSVRVVRAGDAPVIVSERSSMRARLLAATAAGCRIELYTLELEPGSERAAAAHTPGAIEHVLVTRGRLLVGPVDAPVELGVGDLVSFPADSEHLYVARESSTSAVMVMEYP